MNKKYLFIALGFILVVLDQIIKALLVNINIDFGFFALNYVENTGISFGLFQGSTIIISIISVIVLGLLYYFRKEFEEHKLFLTFIVAGIIGNLIDRVFLGYVRDFFDLKWWPVFNIADSLLFIGVFGLLITHLILEIRSRKQKKVNKKTKKNR